ncbi:AI-2E family transporter [Paenibacillus sp. J2TS4]|uniref:AI-2E family transporter n=1 Tax=Paenibacillus sp. J2TS4 TaxID=2807194 RepID=UPI001AFD9E1A|nr:AI-2E family transporter [Paenibacillus sp. J2TS4]GIP31954.1 AI-2E family transporter [Paenibacillus sp. J2TS4]
MFEAKTLFQNRGFRRFVILATMVIVLYSIRSILDLILITFIFIFLMNRLQHFVVTRLEKIVKVNRKLVILLLYTAIVFGLGAGLYKFFPVIVVEISQLIRQITDFYTRPQDNEIVNYIVNTIKEIELTGYMEKGFDFLYKSISNIGKWGLQIFLALILSLFFLLDKQRIQQFTSKLRESKISAFYQELEYFGQKFVGSFGKVIEVQFMIALVNCVLSVIVLSFMGFPHLFALGLLIFVLGLIPVAGVIISLIPLCTIAFTIGGIPKVIYILIMIAIIHAVEAYFLNPKFMSSKTNLPVFYTFVVLIFCEHFFGVWGLIIGIPMFIFILDVIEVKDYSH